MKSNRKMVDMYMKGSVEKKRAALHMFDVEELVRAFITAAPNMRKLLEAGATFCCGNDGGTPLSFPGLLSAEMEILQWLGFSKADIIRSATINGAKLLDLESEIGSLEPGKLADILVLSSDPMKDIRAIERVEAVFRSGTLLHQGYKLPIAVEA